MSRSSAPVLTTTLLLLLLPLLLLGVAVLADDAHTTDTICSVQSCAALDIAVLSSYVSGFNVSKLQWPTTDTSNESTQQLPPFGALASDWSRLLMLQNRQPEGTPLRDNLLRLSRILLAAYFDAEDDGGAEWSTRTGDDGQAKDQQASRNNTTTTTAAAEQKKKDISDDNEEATPTMSANNNREPKNLNRTFPTMDNEANGRNGNESTTLTPDNEDESGRMETSGALGTTTDDRFALTTTVANEGKSLESSGENEAVHTRSKEDFLESKYTEKEDDGDDRVARFFMSDESDELVNNFFAMEDNVVKANQSSVEETTDRLMKSLEDFFNGEDNENNTSTSANSASVVFNSTKSIEDFFAKAEEVRKITATTDAEINFNSQDSEEIISPSVEDFFAHEEDFVNATTMDGNWTSGEVEVTKSIEDFFKSNETLDDENKVETNKSLLVNSTTSDGNVTNNDVMVPEKLDVFTVTREENKTVIEKKDGVMDKLASDESKKIIEDDKSTDTITSTMKLEETTTTATTAVENTTSSETVPASTTTESYLQNNVTSTSTDTLTTLVSNSLRYNDNLTTLAQLISGQLSTLPPASNSNEITSQVNRIVEQSAKNSNTTEDTNKLDVTTSTSLPSENLTTTEMDNLSTTTERQTKTDVPVTQASIEVPIEEAVAVTAPLVRLTRHVPTSSHVNESSKSQQSSHKSSKVKKSSLSQPLAPATRETQRRRRRHRSVRWTHKRTGTGLDDQEYRTFPEHRQTQFAEKRSRQGTHHKQQ